MKSTSKFLACFLSFFITANISTTVFSMGADGPGRGCSWVVKRGLSYVGLAIKNAFTQCAKSKPTITTAGIAGGMSVTFITGKAAYDLATYLGLSADPLVTFTMIYIAELGMLGVVMKADGASAKKICYELTMIGSQHAFLLCANEPFYADKLFNVDKECQEIFGRAFAMCMSDPATMKNSLLLEWHGKDIAVMDHGYGAYETGSAEPREIIVRELDLTDKKTLDAITSHCEWEAREGNGLKPSEWKQCQWRKDDISIKHAVCTGIKNLVFGVRITKRFSEIITKWIDARVNTDRLRPA